MGQVDKSLQGAQAINVLLYLNDGDTETAFDLNKEGLYRMTFDRYKAGINDVSGILTSIDISMFDTTGSQLTSKLQQSDFQLNLQYGFEDNLSPRYNLNALKLVTNFNEQGIMLSVGAIGQQINQQFPAEVYKRGVMVEDILKEMARRNNWYYDDSTVDCKIRLENNVLKESDMTDAQFIETVLRPLVFKSVVPNSTNASDITFWEYLLVDMGIRYELYFRPNTSRITTRRKWQYSYGTSDQNDIINLKSTMDQTYLINGMTIQVSSDEVEALGVGEGEAAKTYMENKIKDLASEISEIFSKYNIPMMAPDNFKYKVQLIAAENIGNKTLDQRLLEAVEKAVQVVNTAEMTVIGNPHIRPTDLVDLRVKNRDGSFNILTSPTNINSYWRVIGIKESIGIDGYQTHLKMVREIINN